MLCLGGYSGLVPDSGSTATLVLIKTLIVTHRPLPTVSETLEPALPRDRSIKGLGDANWGDPPISGRSCPQLSLCPRLPHPRPARWAQLTS